ncbi:hypothetical protein WJX73_003398 [Symbiochloris irregularis]|uniref:Uncharacterized protein n=1 Tax=Symbiochloris irregularis TaxID=706552 RepID=A0AAW1NNL3_9CHLO
MWDLWSQACHLSVPTTVDIWSGEIHEHNSRSAVNHQGAFGQERLSLPTGKVFKTKVFILNGRLMMLILPFSSS